MHIIAVIAQKGGSGKSTLTVHLAAAAHLAGQRVAVVDLDPQATARKWGDKRMEGPEVIGDHAERLPHLVEAARENGADLLIIDTAPNADRASLAAAKFADLLLVPCRPATFDIEAIGATLDLAEIARKPAFVVLNAAPVRSKLAIEARDGLKARGAKVAPIIIHHRVAFSHSVIDGRTALEYEPEGKAAEEIRKLHKWVRQQVGASTRTRAAA